MSLALYRPIARLAHRVLPLVGGKMAAGLAGRRGATDRWLAWAHARPAGRPLAWVHAASVGEWLAAAPVVRRLRAARRDLEIVLTYSSPSLARWPHSPDVDRADYIPPDEPGAMRAVYAVLRPGAVLVVRGDLWPELLANAHRQAVPVAVIGGAVSPESARLAWPLRRVFHELYRPIAYAGAVTRADGERFERLGIAPGAIAVTGDPRHDQVLERIVDLSAVAPLMRWSTEHSVLVAGSTHARDESVVLRAFAEVRRGHASAGVLIVPHEPGPGAAARVAATARSCGVETASWPVTQGIDSAHCLVTQTIGSLADLYACAQMAYVGGGFQRAGVHAVIEPAAYALPVMFGPAWSKSDDARRLLIGGGGTALPRQPTVGALAERWAAWLEDPAERTSAGQRARRTLTAGAATATARAVLRLLALGA